MCGYKNDEKNEKQLIVDINLQKSDLREMESKYKESPEMMLKCLIKDYYSIVEKMVSILSQLYHKMSDRILTTRQKKEKEKEKKNKEKKELKQNRNQTKTMVYRFIKKLRMFGSTLQR